MSPRTVFRLGSSTLSRKCIQYPYNSYARRYRSTHNHHPWAKDPTYHKIVPPESRQWTMPKIPANIILPHYAKTGGVSPWDDIIPLGYEIGPPEWYDQYLVQGMRNAGRRAAECLAYAKSLVKPGITTLEIDRKVTEWAFQHNCYPSSLNYGGFQGSLCTSVNNVISHGVPNEYFLVSAYLISVSQLRRVALLTLMWHYMFRMSLPMFVITVTHRLPFQLGTFQKTLKT